MIDTANWRKSSFSEPNGGNCVEIATLPTIMVRDTKLTESPILHFSATSWANFVSTQK